MHRETYISLTFYSPHPSSSSPPSPPSPPFPHSPPSSLIPPNLPPPPPLTNGVQQVLQRVLRAGRPAGESDSAKAEEILVIKERLVHPRHQHFLLQGEGTPAGHQQVTPTPSRRGHTGSLYHLGAHGSIVTMHGCN